LKDIYWAEKALLKALPTMMKNATHEKLKKAIENHMVETEGHVERLEECFKALGKKAQAKNVMRCRVYWMKEKALSKKQNPEL
jgi:ferritin-like metal-binding protein YciE